MKRIHFAILFFIVFLSPYLILLAQKPEFRIESTKDVFLKHEPVWIKLVLKNNSNQIIVVSNNLSASNSLLNWKLSDTTGNVFEYRWMIPHKDIPSYKLTPGDSIFSYFDLLLAFGEKETSISPMCYLEKGVYHLSVIYQHYGIPLEANPISFIVKHPIGEEAEAFTLFREAYKAWSIHHYQKAKEPYNNFINTYPNSTYMEIVLNSLCFTYKWGLHDNRELLNLSENFINNRPQSPFINDMLSHFINAYGSLKRTGELKGRLREFAEKYGDINPLLRRIVLERIEELKL